jgi:hypothetical protein
LKFPNFKLGNAQNSYGEKILRIHSEIGIEEKAEMEISQGEDLHKIQAKS